MSTVFNVMGFRNAEHLWSSDKSSEILYKMLDLEKLQRGSDIQTLFMEAPSELARAAERPWLINAATGLSVMINYAKFLAVVCVLLFLIFRWREFDILTVFTQTRSHPVKQERLCVCG